MSLGMPECTATGDHYWFGSVCSACGARLRCMCGRFVRVEALERHIAGCPVVWQAADDSEAREHDGSLDEATP